MGANGHERIYHIDRSATGTLVIANQGSMPPEQKRHRPATEIPVPYGLKLPRPPRGTVHRIVYRRLATGLGKNVQNSAVM